jgi:hypothetical protein
MRRSPVTCGNVDRIQAGIFRRNETGTESMLKTWLLLLCACLPATAFGQAVEIYVSDAGNFQNPPWQILKFDANGNNPEVFITQNLDWPQDILFLEAQDVVLVSNLNSGRIDRYNARTGAFISVFANNISGPTRMKIGPDGLLYVLQWTGLGRVLRYQLNGAFVDEFTEMGVAQAIGLDWDAAGRLYVASYSGGSVRRFDTDGADMGLFIGANLAGPTNIEFTVSGDLLVSDYDAGSIKRFAADAVYEGIFIGGLASPEGIAQLPGGDLLIGNGGTRAVKRYTPAGVFVEDFVASGAGGLLLPNAVVVRRVPFQINAGIADAWYDPATDGQGFLITVFPDIEQIFLAWFTYDTQRPPEDVEAHLGEPGHRWLTAQGPYTDDTAELTLHLTAGGVFDAANPPATTDPQGYGTLTLQFADCENAVATYEIPSLNRSGQIPLQRITDARVALCQSLAE